MELRVVLWTSSPGRRLDNLGDAGLIAASPVVVLAITVARLRAVYSVPTSRYIQLSFVTI